MQWPFAAALHPNKATMQIIPQADPAPPSASVTPSRNELHLQLLIETGLLLASERSLDVIVQAALDAGLRLCGASFGAFFYNNPGEDGESYQLYKVSGLDPSAFAAFPMPRPTASFEETFLARGIVRSPDITQDPHYGQNAPFAGMPPGHPPVRSYLVVPVSSRGGEVLGGLFYGHSTPNVFLPESNNLVATIAAQAAVALENVRLAEHLNREIAVAEAARALQRQTAERLRQAVEAAQLGTWSWDRATDLLDLDDRAATMFDAQSHTPITRTGLRNRIVNQEDQPHTTANLQEALEHGGLYTAEYRVDRLDGIRTWIASNGVAVFRPGTREVTGMIGTSQDITARKTAEASLRQSEKLAATGRLAATIAHEINNPLEAVTNLIYLCKTDPEVPSAAQLLLETADKELARVAQIAQQTLGFYRDTARPAVIDMNELLHGVVDLFGRRMLTMRISCDLELEPDLSIFGLHGEIRQVFSNLVVNAIDASPAGSSLRIRGRRRRGQYGAGISILIADQGTGIPQHLRPRLFSPFFTTKQTVGTGLGLWVTRGIIEKHGGGIAFRSRTEMPTGTTFRIYLVNSRQTAPTEQTAVTFIH
jgi:PAS domain S-box-containing protein